jgi:hypothetical protein
MIVLLLLLTTLVAGADPPTPPHPGPAMFLTGEEYTSCWIFDVEDNWCFIEDCSPTISLIPNSKTGGFLWTAKAQIPDDDPDCNVLPEKGAVHFTYENSGFACWWSEGVETTNYSITITPKGKFNISCHFRPDKWQPE